MPDELHAANGAGALQCGRFVVAAEWVGVLSSRGPGGDELRFAPGGVAHALDRSSGQIVCGADVRELEVFWIDFLGDDWSLRCGQCERIASESPHSARRRGAAIRSERELWS